MGDWIETLKQRLGDESLPLPENDWEWYEAAFRQRRRRRLLAWWSASAIGIAAAVGLLVSVIPPRDAGTDILVEPEPLLADVTESPVMEKTPVAETAGTFGPAQHNPFRPLPQLQPASPDDNPSPTGGPDPAIEQAPVKEQAPAPAPDQVSEADQISETATVSDADQVSEPEGQPIAAVDFTEPQTTWRRKTVTVSPYAGGMGRTPSAYSTRDRMRTDYAYLNLPVYQHALDSKEELGLNNKDWTYSVLSEQFTHSVPVSFGIDVVIPLTERFSVTSGAELSLFKSRVSGTKESQTQKAYYLGIPLRLEWTAWEGGPASIWLGAGGKVDRLVWGRIGSSSLTDRTFHWSASGVAGIQYELLRGVGLFFQPEISYYFKPSSPAILTYRTENPLMLSLDAGFRIKL